MKKPMAKDKKTTLKIVLMICSFLLCIISMIIAIIPYANGEIEAHRTDFQAALSEYQKYSKEAEAAHEEYIDMQSRAGSYRLTHSAQEYATYERKMGTYKTLWEINEELASYYDDISYYSLTKFHSIENRSTVYFIVSAALFLGTIGAFVWLRTSKKRTVPSNQEQTNALQEFYCPQCNSPVQLNDPACKKCGQIFDWSKQ